MNGGKERDQKRQSDRKRGRTDREKGERRTKGRRMAIFDFSLLFSSFVCDPQSVG